MSSQIRAVGYVRVSTDEQAERFSPDAQSNEILQSADRQGWDLVEIYDEDKGASSKTLDRHALAAIRERAKTEDFQRIIVTELDRLSREPGHLWPLVLELRPHKIGVVVSRFPSVSSLDKEFYAMYGGVVGMSYFETELRKDRQRRATAVAKAEGRHLGRQPVGFFIDNKKKSATFGKLIPDALGESLLQIVSADPRMNVRELQAKLNDTSYPKISRLLKHLRAELGIENPKKKRRRRAPN